MVQTCEENGFDNCKMQEGNKKKKQWEMETKNKLE